MQNFELSGELFAALIGVVIALALTAMGWLINSTVEQSKWLRNERLKVYREISKLCSRLVSLERDKQKMVRQSLLLGESIAECESIIEDLSQITKKGLTYEQFLHSKSELERRKSEFDEKMKKNKADLEVQREHSKVQDERYMKTFETLSDLIAEFSILTSYRMGRKMRKFLAHSSDWYSYTDVTALDKDTEDFNKKQSRLWLGITNAAKRDVGAQHWIARLLKL